MDPRLSELDDKGIIPLIDETEEQFIKRGTVILKAVTEVSDYQLIDYIYRIYTSKKATFFPNPFYSKKKVSTYLKCLEYIKAMYGSDLSWVRILDMVPSFNLDINGITINVVVRSEVPISFPVVGLFNKRKRTILHELLHTARWGIISYIIDQPHSVEFEEKIAQDQYFRSGFLSIHPHSRKLLKVKRKLERYFPKNHGYVFIRLSYEELISNILPENSPYGDPINYIRELSNFQLKYRILREKLGL